jgi:hypothetical protein
MVIALLGVAFAAEVDWEVQSYTFAGGERRVGRAFLEGRRVYGVHRVEGPGWVRGGLPGISMGAAWEARVPASEVAPRVREAYGLGPEPRVHEGWLVQPGQLAPVWVVDLRVAGPATWRVWVDARTGQPLRADKTSREARGDIYPTNPVLSVPQRVELPNLVSETSLQGSQVYTASCDEWQISDSLFGVTECLASSPHASPDGGGDYLFVQDPGSLHDPAAEVHVYYHVDQMSTWLVERFGLALPYAPIQGLTNFEWANAMFGDFDGDGLPDVSFGQSDGVDLAYDADVVYHELGHAVVNLLAPELPFLRGDEYGLEWASGAVNEGAADVFSMVLTGDPLVGEYAGQAFGDEAVRDLSQPRRCPDDLQGEVHYDGEILGTLAWRLISEPLVGPDLVAEWLVGAIPLWGPDTDWPLVGESLRLSADDLLAAGVLSEQGHAVMIEALVEWNLEGCGRVAELALGEPQSRLLVTGGLQASLQRLPGGTQLSLEVPADATALRLTVLDFRAREGMGYVWMGRSAQPVHHEWTMIDLLGLGFSTPETFDWEVGGLSEPAVIELVPGGEPPLVPGETLYLSLASDNLGTLEPFVFSFGDIEFTATLERATAEPERPGGCGCGSAPAPSGVWLVLAGLWLRRRSSWS